ncbi:MAG: M56 family metallopeptidase [Clostridia bacterium]|nr:M56 family metallopeptidase [Clostridia bacterium]
MLGHLLSFSGFLAVFLLLRAVFRRRISPQLMYALWLVVLVRLCLPVTLFEIPLPILAETNQTVQSGEQPDVPPSSSAGETVVSPPSSGGYLPITPVTPPTPGETTVPGTAEAPVPGDPLPIAPVVSGTEAPPPPPAFRLDYALLWRIVRIVWAAGSAAALIWFGGSAAVFAVRLRKTRRPDGRIGRTRVWISDAIDTPCLAGIPPAVYLTPAGAATSAKALVLYHEYSHLRQGDWLWAPLRTLVLCLYWFNPLVWAAVSCAAQDAELACDAAVASRLNDGGRLRYARMIVDMLPRTRSYAVGFGAGSVKERITRLTTAHKNRWIAGVLAVVLLFGAVGCSLAEFTPGEQTTAPPDTDDPPVSDSAVQLDDQITLLSNPGEVEFRIAHLPAKPGEYDVFRYDERYTLYHIWGEMPSLRLWDSETGIFAAECTLPYSGRLASVSYTSEGLILYDYTLDDIAYSVIYADGALYASRCAAPTEIYSYPLISPGGDYRVQTVADRDGRGGIDLITVAGGVQRILSFESSAQTRPVAFRDDTSFYYLIGGWRPQLAVYDILTGTSTPAWSEETQQLMGVHGGRFFLAQTMEDDTPVALGSGQGDGILAIDFVFGEEERSLYAPFDRNIRMIGGKWFLASPDRPLDAENIADCYGVMMTVEMRSSDCREVTANLRMPFGLWHHAEISFAGSLCGIVLPEVEIEPVQSYGFLNVLTNPGGLNFAHLEMPTSIGYYYIIAYDDTHRLIYSYDPELDQLNNTKRCYNQYLRLLDLEAGRFVAECAVDSTERLSSNIRTDAGFILYAAEYDDLTQEVFTADAKRIVYADGRLSAEPVEFTLYPQRELFVTPDGRYRVYDTQERTGAGGIDLVMPDGSERRVLTNRTLEEATSLGDVIGYTPMGYVDDTHLLYHIGGYEWSRGYGVLDVTTGACRTLDFLNSHNVYAIRDGKIYADEYVRGNETYSRTYLTRWCYTLDGAQTKLTPADPSVNPFAITFSGELGFYFDRTALYAMPHEEANKYAVHCTVYSLDLEVLATLTVPWNQYGPGVDGSDLYAGRGAVTLITPPGAKPPEKAPILSADNAAASKVEVLAQQNVDLRMIGVPLEEGEQLYHYYQKLDDRYRLSLIYRKDGESYTDLRLWLFDTTQGSYVASTTLPDGVYPQQIGRSGDRSVIFSVAPDPQTQMATPVSTFALEYSSARLTATPVELTEIPDDGEILYSWDKKYTVHNVSESDGSGGIDLIQAGGKTKRILSNKTVDEAGLGGATRYHAVAFIDGTRLVYNMSGWEWSKGIGIYDVNTGRNTVFDEMSSAFVWNNVIYAREKSEKYNYAVSRIWQIDSAGNKTLLREFDEDEQRRMDSDELVYLWRNGVWISYDQSAVRKDIEAALHGEVLLTVDIYAADFAPLATLRMPYSPTFRQLFESPGCSAYGRPYENLVCLILPMPKS